MEDQVTVLVNRERSRGGCPRVHTDERLRTAARRHSDEMAEYAYFSHTSRDGSDFVDRLAAAGYPRADAAGENIAYGYPNPQSVVEAWMGSSGHRDNILNCDVQASATGLAYQGRTPYWTQDFGYR
ncbi:CAP domain-containing protein [Catellatospora sp. NEAU-YM18]|nr:CAP domain-containing protein [Catellatospora tritici]